MGEVRPRPIGGQIEWFVWDWAQCCRIVAEIVAWHFQFGVGPLFEDFEWRSDDVRTELDCVEQVIDIANACRENLHPSTWFRVPPFGLHLNLPSAIHFKNVFNKL